jgi:PAS domain S-box-containing protein
MKINGKPKTPITAAQKKDSGEKAQASRTTSKKNNGVKSAVLDRISDGILALDAGLNYAYLNERAGELLGCNPVDLIGKNLWQAHPDVERTPFAEACRRALETRSVVMLDGYFPASDRWLEGRVYPSDDGVSVLFSEGTQQKQEENRRREERYRILFDTMQEGFLLAEIVEREDGTRDARLLEVNASMSRFLARPRDELVGKTVRDVFQLDEEDQGVLELACRVALGEADPFFLERYESAAGYWLRAHIFSPRTGQFASLITDITEQKEAEAKLEDVSKLPGQSPNPVLRFAPAGEILYANQASQVLLSAWEQHEAHTTPLQDIRALLPSVLESGQNYETEVVSRDTFYMGLLVPVVEEGYINLYLRDITGRKQAEETLRAHIHQTNAGITRTDLEGRFTFVNHAFCEMVGYSETELLHKTIWEISHPDDIARNRTMFQRLVQEGESFQLEKRILRRNGSFLWINVGSSPLRDASGRIQAATSIIVDINRRKRAEESLLESARRTLYLSSLSDAMRSQSDPSRIQMEASRLLGASLRASRVAYMEMEPDGTAVVRNNYVDNVPDIIRQFQVDDSIPADQRSRFRAGRTVTASDIQNDQRFDEAQKSVHRELRVRAQIVVPFLHNGELIAALCIQQEQPRVWRNDEIALVEETAERLQAEIERVHAERKLRESEERLQTAQRAGNVGIWDWDAATDKTYWSETMWTLHGYQQAMEEKVWEQSQHPEDRQRVQEKVAKALASSDTEYRDEYRIIHPDGSIHWIEAVARIIRDESGKPVRMSGVNLDITERKQMETAIRESEERFRALISQATAGIAESDMQGRFTFVNPRFCEMLGYSESELLAKTVFELTYKDDRAENRRFFERMVQEGESYQFEKRYIRKDGSLLWTDVSVTTIHDLDGNPKGGVGVVLDIEKRKQAEQALRASEELYRAIARSIPGGGIYVVDQELRYRVAEGTVTEAFGLTREVLEGRTVTEAFPDERGQRMEERLRRNFAGEVVQYETRFNDRVYWTQQAPLQDSMGRVIILTLDITERKRAEEAMTADLANMQILRDLGARLVSEADLHVIYQEFVRAAIAITHADAGTVQLLDEGSNELILLATEGLDQGMIEYFQRVKAGSVTSCGIALASRERAFVEFDDPVAQDPEGSLRRHVEAGLLSAQSTPLISRSGQPIGMISTHWREHHRPTDQELRYIDLLARQAADLIERRQSEGALRASEERFREIFETAGVSVWVEDFSEVKTAIDELRRQGVHDFRTYFAENPDFVRQAVELVRVVDVNNETLDLYRAESKADMIRSLPRVFTSDTEPIFAQELIALAEGHEMLRTEASMQTLDGQPLSVLLSLHFNPRAGDYSRVVVTVTDITARKQTEEELQRSEERFARFMQHLPGLAWLKDVKGRYVYANAGAEKAFGIPLETLYGLSDKDIFPADIAEQFRKNDELALLDEKGVQVVETLEHEDQVLHYSLVSKFPIPGPDGRPALIGGTAFDITERVHMEDALQAARERAEETAGRMQRLQKVTASLSEVLTPLQVLQVIVDQGGPSLGAVTGSVMLLSEDSQSLEIVYSNARRALVQTYQSFPLSLSVPSADAVRSGQPVWLESRRHYLERYPHLADQIQQWGQEAALAIPMVHKGQTLGVLTLSFDHVLPHSHEDQEYILTLARQGAQALGRARAEEALRESEERYRAIFSQATAGIVRKDSAGRLIFVNQAFCNMLGVTEMELLGRIMWELTHEEDAEENKRLYNRLMAEGTPFQLEKRLIRQDGSTLWVNVSVSPLMGESGRPQSAVSVYVDVTRRKQAENRLTLLARVSELTRQFEETDDLLYAVSREVGEHFQVRRALFNEIDVENDREVVHRDYCRGVESVAGVHRISDYSSITSEEMKAGRTVVNVDSKTDPRTARDYERSYVENGERAYVTVPLLHNERWTASLWISDDKPRQWDREDVYLLEAIAERTWAAAEKMRVDRALRDSEERLRVTFNTTAVGFALLTPDTRFVDVNDALCHIVGYTREELVMMTLDTLVHPDFIKSTHDHIAWLLDGQVPSFSIEKLYIRGDGAEIWVQNNVSLVRDADGNPLHLIAICQDVTERKREEEALRARTEEIETLMNVSPIGIFVANDPECKFISGNPAGYELLEMTHSSARNISKSAPLQDQPGYRVFREGVEVAPENMPMQSAARHGIELKEEALELRFENGTRKYIYAFAKPLFDTNGRSRGAIAAMLDITERKRVEDELHHLNLRLEERVSSRTAELQAAYEFLRESEATSRLILESMPDAIVITDRDGRIVHANTQVETLFGYTPNEVLGKPVEILLPKRLHARHLANRDGYTNHRVRRIMGLGMDLFGLRKDGSEFPVDVMLSPINNSTSWDVMVAIRDNTKQREAQEALRTNEEKLRTLFEIVPIGISFLGKDGRILDMNPALTNILGMSKEALLKGTFKSRRYIRSDGTTMSPKEYASVRAITEQKTVYNVETGIVRENGEIKWTSVNAAPVRVADVEVVVATVDITERKQAEEAIDRHRESLKLLSRRLVEVQEDERRALARELHDRVGQNLAALTLNLNILRSQLTPEILEKIGTRLNDSVNLVKDVLAITRSVMADLRPNVLDDYGLDAALSEYADRFSQRFGIRVVNNMPSTPTPRMDPGIEMTLLRIAQEALTNIARHAQASQASMTLELEDNAAHMVIEDNGIGILSWQKVNQPGSHGMRIMRERAEALGGSMKVHSAYKNGTKIEVQIPVGAGTNRTQTAQEKKQ